MPTPDFGLTALEILRREIALTAQVYHQDYNVRLVTQGGVEHEWEMFCSSIEALPTDLHIPRAFRQLFLERVRRLLLGTEDARIFGETVLLERRLLLTDVDDARAAIERILQRSTATMQQTLWQGNEQHNVRQMSKVDFEQVCAIEKSRHEHPWTEAQFKEWHQQWAKTRKVYEHYGEQSPTVCIVTVPWKKPEAVSGYAVASRISVTRNTKTIHGTIAGQRTALQVLTHGTSEDSTPEATQGLMPRLIACAAKLACTRVEDCFEEHHRRKA